MIASADLVLSTAQATELAACVAELGDLVAIEAAILGHQSLGARLESWFRVGAFCNVAKALWATHDHFVVRNVPPSEDGITGLLLANGLFSGLKSYRGTRIVKQFRMSPWTTELSHTLAEGHFHTDINTSDRPPAATIMQCLIPDPDAPRHGRLRVATLKDVLGALRKAGNSRALRLFMEDEIVMANGTDSETWSGRITDGSTIRFHPETLRAAQRRYGANPPDFEDCLATIHEAALSVSREIDLSRGDVLVVSNRRALHQRSSCTVRFRIFPREFESRTVAVLHALEEPA